MDTRSVEGAYQTALRSFADPMLALLHRTHAPFVVTVLERVFTVERPIVPVADAHAEIDEMLRQLRGAGYGEPDGHPLPAGSARDVCGQWVQAGWLIRRVGENDCEVYGLSAHGVGALEVAGRVGAVRVGVSQSRLRTLLEAIERLATEANPDVMVRRARLYEEITQRQAELARLDAGGELESIDDEQLLESAENVLHLARELPADFARVAESIKANQRAVVTELRQDVRPSGDVLLDYLNQAKHIRNATPQGRAFSGALRLIGDQAQINDLGNDLTTVFSHPFVNGLPPQQRVELRHIARRIEQGVKVVFDAQRQASHLITAQVHHHNPLRDRQVDELLRGVMSGLQKWVPQSAKATKVEPLRRLPVAVLGHLRQRTADLRPPQPPPPLAEWGGSGRVSAHRLAGLGRPPLCRIADTFAVLRR